MCVRYSELGPGARLLAAVGTNYWTFEALNILETEPTPTSWEALIGLWRVKAPAKPSLELSNISQG